MKKFFDNHSSHCIRFFRSQIISLEEIDSDESPPFHLITAARNEGNSTDLCCASPLRWLESFTLWLPRHPESGETEAVSYTSDHGQPNVPLHFDAEGSIFVVIEGSGVLDSHAVPIATLTKLDAINGAWKLTFPPDLGAPREAQVPALESWMQSNESGIRYFSGSTTYHKTVDAPKEWFKPGAKVMLDLGTVKEFAEIEINGKPVGVIRWKPRFVVDVTSALKPGSKANTPLLESGMIGSVTLWRSDTSSY